MRNKADLGYRLPLRNRRRSRIGGIVSLGRLFAESFVETLHRAGPRRGDFCLKVGDNRRLNIFSFGFKKRQEI